MDDPRLEDAQDLLRDAVFQARAAQAAGVSLGGRALDEPAGPGNCGLGETPGLGAALSERGRELLSKLAPGGLDPAVEGSLGSALQAWVDRQDAQDRKRNHYLRDFRQRHGFDRRAYDAAQTRAFEDGLAGINAEEDELRRSAAAGVLAALDRPGA